MEGLARRMPLHGTIRGARGVASQAHPSSRPPASAGGARSRRARREEEEAAAARDQRDPEPLVVGEVAEDGSVLSEGAEAGAATFVK